MKAKAEIETVSSCFWGESAEPDNPFATRQYLCGGYDVFGDMLGKATIAEYLYLLFTGERPTSAQLTLLNGLAISLGNPGPRDFSVRAAMSAAAGAPSMASCLMAALAVGAGNFGGGREVARLMGSILKLKFDLHAWQDFLRCERDRVTTTDNGEVAPAEGEHKDVWLPMEHIAGFDPYGVSSPLPVRQSLDYLSSCSPGDYLKWFRDQREFLESVAGKPLAMPAVAAATLLDLGLDPDAGEMLYLLLRLPGAAAHAVEQRERGWKDYPFHGSGVEVINDPFSNDIKAGKQKTMVSELETEP